MVSRCAAVAGPFLIDLGFKRLHYFIHHGDKATCVLNVRCPAPLAARVRA